MPLYVTVNGLESAIERDLMNILKQSVGPFSTTYAINAAGETVIELWGQNPVYLVSYTAPDSSFPAVRLAYLCNSTPNLNTIIFGVDSGFQFLNGPAITDQGGDTALYQAALFCFYDTSGCDGKNYWTAGQGGKHIATPTDVLLFHELTHAYYASASGYMPAPSMPFARRAMIEAAVIADENKYRDLASPPLEHRDPTLWQQGGCGGPAAKDGNGWCFIINAAFGTMSAARAYDLRRFRDEVIRRTGAGHRAFEAFFQAYYRFSPSIALDMEAAPYLRSCIRDYFVDPYLEFLACVREALQEPRTSKRTSLRSAARRRGAPGGAQGTLRRIAAVLAAPQASSQLWTPPPANDELLPEATAKYLVARMQFYAREGEHALVYWALLDGLRTYYTAVLNESCDTEWLYREILAWMGRAPFHLSGDCEVARIITNPEVEMMVIHAEGVR